MSIATVEDTQIIKAMHQWMQSQNIPRLDWGSLFAIAAGNEVFIDAKGNDFIAYLGTLALSIHIEQIAKQGLGS